MSGAVVKKFKLFWADQDVEQEEWLRSMARQGLHLRKLNWLQQWSFVKGEPADVVYRVDYHREVEPAYQRLLEDAGWELGAQFFGWQYWRTPAVNGHAQQLFTDRASNAAKFKRLLATIGLLSLPMLVMLILPGKSRALEVVSMPFLIAILGLFAINMIGVARLAIRLVKLQREAD